jgi:hypothetical protein
MRFDFKRPDFIPKASPQELGLQRILDPLREVAGSPVTNQPPARHAADNSYSALQSSAAVVHQRLTTELDALLTQDQNLVHDLAAFGDTRLPEILDAYNMTREDLEARLQDDDFSARIVAVREEAKRDSNGMMRLRARMLIDAELDAMHEIAMDRMAKPSDRIKAFQAVTDLAGIAPPKAAEAAGVAAVITFNFGSSPHADQLMRVVGESAQ